MIELGQAALPAAGAPPGGGARQVAVSREEGELMVRTVEAIIAFAKDFPLEFSSYCPMERWEPVLKRVGAGLAQIERQLGSGASSVMVPADTVFAMVDLEECVSGARDARLSSAKLALFISAGGAIAQALFGLTWLSIPTYIASLAIVLGRPLVTRVQKAPKEPFKVGCGPAVEEEEEPDGDGLGDHTDKAKVIERVIVRPGRLVEIHHWGRVHPVYSTVEGAICLSRGKWRVRVEGWALDRVSPAPGWERAALDQCRTARNEIAVWEPGELPPRETFWGDVPASSGHPQTIWVEYTGPMTHGATRRAGPFG